MSASALVARAGLRPALPALIGGLVLLLALFHREASAAVDVWAKSTAYNHGFLILPIAGFLAWERRGRLAGAVAQPWPSVALLALPLAAAWLVAERLGIMEGRQLVLIALVELLVLAVLGRALWRAMAAPLLYLVFLVPFGAFLTPWLQDVTAAFTVRGLDLIGIANYSDGYIIEIPEGTFVIAEACAGLRFLIAAIAFGVLYALTMYRSPWRRVGFIAASVVVPVIANGFRALGIVFLGHLLGSAEAAATDHVLYGWIFFSLVILLLILIGLPFREDGAPRPATPAAPETTPPAVPRGTPFGGAMAAALVLLLAATGPALSAWFDSQATPPPALAFTPGPGCVAGPATGGEILRLQAVCAAQGVTLLVDVFPARVDPGVIVAAQHRLSGEEGGAEVETGQLLVANAVPRRWRLAERAEHYRLTASAVWLNGAPAPGGLRARAVQARASLFGSASFPVLVAVVVEGDQNAPGEAKLATRTEARQRLESFLAGATWLPEQLAALAAGR